MLGANKRVNEDVVDQGKQIRWRTINKDETRSLIENTYVPSVMNKNVNVAEIPSMLSPIHEELIGKRVDNERLFKLAPELEHAAAILVPSILSPNDLKPEIFSLTLDKSAESEATTKQIIELLDGHFGDDLKMSEKLPKWLLDALFMRGARPVMVMPESVIKRIRDSEISMESINTSLTKERAQTIIPSKVSVVDHLLGDGDLFNAVAGIEELQEAFR